MSPAIVAVRAWPLHLPMRSALRWGPASELTSLEHVLVEIEVEGAARGLSEAPVRPTIYGETVVSIREVVERVIGPRLVGCEVDDSDALAAAIEVIPFNHTARGALDMAVHLARAAAAGVGFEQLVGASRREVAVSFILGLATTPAMIEEAERVVAAGVRCLKVKLTGDTTTDDSVFDALEYSFAGRGLTVYADANCALTPEGAARRLERLAAKGVAWVEEPLPVHLIRQRAELKRNSALPLIADDSCFSPSDLERELDFDTFDILNVKPARTGVTASLAMMARAAEAGKGVMVGSQAASGLGTVHAATLALRPEVGYPCELSFPLKLERDSLERALRYERGALSASEIGSALPAQFLYGAPEPHPGGVTIAADSRRTFDE